MKYFSLCSGIEAASVAWHPLGWRAAGFAEIEAFPSAVLSHHYPDVLNFGDMTKFKEWPDATFDVLAGGTPCQSFSVAGLRKGLADPRGNLALTYLAIADRYRPEWILWENVPGVLSSGGGRDFGSFLGGLGQLGYGFAYRVLDAQYVRVDGFGRAVPQRRRRVFVVGCLGGWRRAAAVLFDAASLYGDSAPRREAGKGDAPTLAARTKGGGGLGTDFDCDGGLVCHDVAPTLNAHFGDKQGLEDQHINGGTGLFVAHALRAEGFDASEDGTGRGTPIVPVAYRTSPNCGAWETGDRVDALTTGTDQTSHLVAFAQNQRDEVREMPVAGALAAERGTKQQTYVAFDLRGREGGAMPEGPHETANIRAASGGSSRSYVAHAIQAGALRENPAAGPDGVGVQEGVAYTLEARAEVQAVQSQWAVRRLTPRECERLQGFPDDYSLIPFSRVASKKLDEDFLKYQLRGNPKGFTRDDIARLAADGPRYKALGNSMAVNVMRWIGQRIEEVSKTKVDE